MRRALLILALLVPLRTSATSCITFSPTAREFLTGTPTAVRAVAITEDTLRVTSVLLGEKVRAGEAIHVTPDVCNHIAPGAEYFLAIHCPPELECRWNWTGVARAQEFEHYARHRHTITRSEIMEKLRGWQERKLSTEELRRWLATADARDNIGSTAESLALAVVERIEALLDFAVQAEACNPADAAWLREQGSAIFLERFARLPKQETAAAYMEWLYEHEDAEDGWDPERLEDDLERSLEAARPWDHTIDCFLKTRSEASK